MRIVDAARREPDPRRRIDALFDAGLALPHGAEAAIRSWSSVDPEVRSVQEAVDQQRFDIVYESAVEILADKRAAQLFASWAVFVLVGYEQVSLRRDPEALAWITDQMREVLDSGRLSRTADAD